MRQRDGLFALNFTMEFYLGMFDDLCYNFTKYKYRYLERLIYAKK